MFLSTRMKDCQTNKLSQNNTQSQADEDCIIAEQVNVGISVKTECDEDPIWACYSEKEWDCAVSGFKTEPLWVKSEPLEMNEADSDHEVPLAENITSVLGQNEPITVKNERPIWESIWDSYNSTQGKEDRTLENIKQECLPIKQECWTSSNQAKDIILVPSVSQPPVKDQQTVKQDNTKSNSKAFSLAYKLSMSQLCQSQSLGSTQQTFKEAQVIGISSSSQLDTFLPNMTLKVVHQNTQSLNKPHMVQPEAKNFTSTTNQVNFQSSRPGGIIEGGKYWKRVPNEGNAVNCKHCKKSIKSHYEEGGQHKIPKPSSPKNLIRNWKCCECHVGFSTLGRFFHHLTKPHAKRTFMCNTCDMSFDSYNKLAYHKSMQHESPVTCEECGKVFRSRFHLQAHSKIHNEASIKHFCELCGKGFRFKSSLQTHMPVHTSERPHECPDCKATFKTSSHLSKHRLIHTDSRPFSCPVCQTGFTIKAYMQAHLKTHNKDSTKKKAKRETRKRKRKTVLQSESEEEEEEWQGDESEEEEEEWEGNNSEEEEQQQQPDEKEEVAEGRRNLRRKCRMTRKKKR